MLIHQGRLGGSWINARSCQGTQEEALHVLEGEVKKGEDQGISTWGLNTGFADHFPLRKKKPSKGFKRT